MENRQGQFGIFAVFVLTTAAAVAFAIVRLPLPVIAKFLMVQTVVVCFVGWAVRNRKYLDPRLPQPKPTVRHVLVSLIPVVLIFSVAKLLKLLVYLKIISLS